VLAVCPYIPYTPSLLQEKLQTVLMMLTAGCWTLICMLLAILLLGVSLALLKYSRFSQQPSKKTMYALRVLTGIAAVLVLLEALLLCATASIRLHLRHMVRTGEVAPYYVLYINNYQQLRWQTLVSAPLEVRAVRAVAPPRQVANAGASVTAVAV